MIKIRNSSPMARVLRVVGEVFLLDGLDGQEKEVNVRQDLKWFYTLLIAISL